MRVRHRYGRIWGCEDDFAFEQSHQAFHIFDLVWWNRIEVAIPDRDVSFLPRLNRPDLILQKHLSRAPGGIATERGVNVDGLCDSERVQAVSALGRLTNRRCP